MRPFQSVRKTRAAACVFSTAICLGASAPGHTMVLNGGFENGTLFPWSQRGAVSVVDATFGTPPSQGRYQALLQTLGGINRFELEADFLGLPLGALNDLGFGTVFSGSAMRQGFRGMAGQVLSFDWNFLSDELDERAVFDDFAFAFIGPALDDLTDKNADGFLSTLVPGFDGETGYRTFSYTLPVDGFYSIGVGVINVGDDTVNSALLIDNVSLESVPTPALLPGLLGFGMAMAKKRRRSPTDPLQTGDDHPDAG